MRILLLFLLISQALATVARDADDPSLETMEDVITEETVAGRFLTYDCKEGHWVCVIKTDFEECVQQRADDNRRKKKKLSCAPIGAFPNKRSCFQRQLYMVSQNHGSRLCIADQWKQRELN